MRGDLRVQNWTADQTFQGAGFSERCRDIADEHQVEEERNKRGLTGGRAGTGDGPLVLDVVTSTLEQGPCRRVQMHMKASAVTALPENPGEPGVNSGLTGSSFR